MTNNPQYIDSVLIVKSCEKTTAEVLEDLEKSKTADAKSIAELIKSNEEKSGT